MLITVSEKLIDLSGDEKSILAFIRDYLEARLVLLKDMPVSLRLLFASSLSDILTLHADFLSGISRSYHRHA